MNYQLKKAKASDKNNIYQLKKNNLYFYIKRIWGWDEEFQVKLFNEEFQLMENFNTIWIDKKFAGYLEVVEYEGYLSIAEIQLKKEYQSGGIGTKLIKQVIKKATNLGKNVHLGCFKENLGALNLYKRLGFEVIETTESHYVLLKQC